MPTIFVSAYRNFALRYILYTDILKELNRSGVRIVVFLRDNDLDYYRERLGDKNVIFEPVLFETAMQQLRSGHISKTFVVARKCMSGSKSGWENSTDQFRLYQYGREFSGSPRAKLNFLLIRALATIGKRVATVRKGMVALESRIFPGKMYDGYFEKYNPQMLITSSLGYMIDPYFMRSAKRHGCKVVSIIHGWDNPTTKDYRGANPDHVIVWNEIMKREVNVFHDIPKDRIHVGGIAHWDLYFNGRHKRRSREQFLESNELSKNRKTIFYATSSFRKNRNTFEVIERLLQVIREDRFVMPTQLLVRLHPHYLLKVKGQESQVIEKYKTRIDGLRREYGDLVSFKPPMMKVLNDDIDMPVEDMHYLAETMHYSDVLLNEYSTMTFEGAIFDLPVINVALYNYKDTDKPASYEENLTHVKRMLQYGATKNAYTIDQLLEYIDYYLDDPSRDRDKRKNLVDQEVTTNRGCAGESIGKWLLSLAGVTNDARVDI